MFPGRIRLLLSLMTGAAVFYTVIALRSISDVTRPRNSEPAEVVAAAAEPDRASQLNDYRLTATTGNRRSDLFPDVPLTDQYGKIHRFRSDIVRDNIVCVVLFYTQCQGSCPGTTQMMKRLRESLKDDFAEESVKFVSISLDPENDTPEDLLAYADNNGISLQDDMPEWIFCTGKPEDVESIRLSLGLYDPDPIVDADRTEHAALLTFGNDEYDRWAALPAGLKFSDLSETFRRISGTTERQRFETRITSSAALVRARQNPSGDSCCTKTSQNGIKPCCNKTTDSLDLPNGTFRLGVAPGSRGTNSSPGPVREQQSDSP